MTIVFDADIISTFAKIERLDVLKKIFAEPLLFPDAVHDDLLRALDAGHNYIQPALKACGHVSLNEAELRFVEMRYGKTLGLGELECIAICFFRKHSFASNDRKAQQEAKKQGITVITLSDILWMIKEKTTNEELRQIIQAIEEKDNTTIKGKELLLK